MHSTESIFLIHQLMACLYIHFYIHQQILYCNLDQRLSYLGSHDVDGSYVSERKRLSQPKFLKYLIYVQSLCLYQ